MNDGRGIPTLGLGVWQAAGSTCYDAVRAALELGYRHIDTARVYGNEREVGRALRDSGVAREDVFVTTKLWNADQGFDSALAACRKSLADLGMEWVDLYLVHFPVSKRRQESWRALEQLRSEGLARSIGVSNYTTRHLSELLSTCRTPPALNQVEMHPFLAQRELRAFCGLHSIVVEAYSPLAHGERIDDARIGAIASRHERTNAQVMIRWALQHDTVVIPKSVRRERLAENLDVLGFELSSEDMASLDALDEGYRTCWDPSEVP
jgi:diketogulonate reductase-like aldo/keto reductase